MPLYDIECQDCGHDEEIYQTMGERGHQKAYPSCQMCGGETKRVYTVPAIHGMDTEEPGVEWSNQLTTGKDPVYVKNKAHQKQLMKEMGLRPWEPCEDAAVVRKREARKRIKERSKEFADHAIEISKRGGEYINREISKIKQQEKEAA